ncbi:MAG: histidine kinase [Verrucomicrobiales bacterium]|nr:histidine kinase [Verrucomicrobiales bacterium]
MSRPVPIAPIRRLRFLGIYLLIWVLVLGAFAAQYRWGFDLTWQRAVTRVVVDWSPWMILAPFVWWLANRFSIFEKEGRLRKILLHVVVSVGLVILAEAMIVYAVGPLTQTLISQGTAQSASPPRGGGGNAKGPKQRRRPINARHGDGEYEFQTFLLVRKAQYWFPLYWVLVFLTSSAQHYREAQEREKEALQLERDLAKARLKAIQSKLEPHFFFNTLNSISSLVHSDPEKADEMIALLSGLLRRVLARSETQQIALREELDLLREYLAIQKIRFPERLAIQEDIDDKTLAYFVPTLLLQPLAENAIRHGIEPKLEGSTLLIRSRMRDDKRIELTVEDDGIGWENTRKKDKPPGGFGLANIRSRLEALYGGEGEVSISTPEAGGTRITICFPASEESIKEH